MPDGLSMHVRKLQTDQEGAGEVVPIVRKSKASRRMLCSRGYLPRWSVRIVLLPSMTNGHQTKETGMKWDFLGPGRSGAAVCVGCCCMMLSACDVEGAQTDSRGSIAATNWASPIAGAVAQLASPQVNEQIAAARELGQMGCAAEPAVPDLIMTLTQTDSELRASVAWALGQIGDATPEVRRSLLSMLGDDVRFVCDAATASLIELGFEAPNTHLMATNTR